MTYQHLGLTHQHLYQTCTCLGPGWGQERQSSKPELCHPDTNDFEFNVCVLHCPPVLTHILTLVLLISLVIHAVHVHIFVFVFVFWPYQRKKIVCCG